ncbi:hypothetical protein JCM33374_g2328 [Metschnikowia sp. JCM 33374]|nr:hypothetical protein JCM33374_g2328 [Metschnikowia sp. JCM 33374]
MPSNLGRSALVDSLIAAFGLHEKCSVVNVGRASAKDLCTFHDPGYIGELLRERRATEDEGDDKDDKRGDGKESGNHEYGNDESGNDDNREAIEIHGKAAAKYGLAFDCPPFANLNEYVTSVAGSSLSAANVLLSKANHRSTQHVAVNWYGGRHHASRNSASGFCYVNDIVLAILRLRTRYKRVFYLDVDLHHGDGVEAAFRFSKNVTTCSIHRHDVGFFPGTGATSAPGVQNIPTKRGLSDNNFRRILAQIVTPLIAQASPDVIVLQCGSDGLACDPSGEWNLTIDGLATGILNVVNTFTTTPFLVLGGGGYNHTETAKFCAWLTKKLVGDDSEWSDIPEHSHLDSYEHDGFQFWTPDNKNAKPGRRDENIDLFR